MSRQTHKKNRRSIGGRSKVKSATKKRIGKGKDKKMRIRKGKMMKTEEREKERENIAIKIHEVVDAPVDIENIEYDDVNHTISPELNKDTMIVGIVHASWCSHCTDLMESESEHHKTKWQEMQDIIASESKSDECPYKNIKTMAIDDDNKAFIENFDRKYRGKLFTDEFKAPSFPYIVRINGGKIEKYDGARDPRSMANWFLSKTPIV